jgi:hypothetical protein
MIRWVWRVCIRGSQVEAQSPSTQEPDQLQHDRFAACVIAQQYSSTIFISFCFHSHKKKIVAPFKNAVISVLFIAS